VRTLHELRDLLASHAPSAAGAPACLALRWSAAEPPPPLRDPVVAAAHDGVTLLALRPCRTGAEALLWAEDAAARTGRAAGLSTFDADPISGALRALEAAEAFSITPVCPALLAVALGAARRIADEQGILPTAERWQRLLRRLAPRLGPAQLRHTVAHGEQVARTASRLATVMRLGPEAIEHARLAALLHGLGKLALPEDLFAAGPGGLSARERTILARLPGMGAAIARELGAPAPVEAGIARCRDRFDARPRPPLTARLLRVADALTVMTTPGARSAARTLSDALARLRRGRGTRFDPDAVVAAHLLGAGAMALAA
jgi:hypothetical protein